MKFTSTFPSPLRHIIGVFMLMSLVAGCQSLGKTLNTGRQIFLTTIEITLNFGSFK